MRGDFIELMLHVCKLVSTNFTQKINFTQKDQSTCSTCTFTVLQLHYKAPITTDLGSALPMCSNAMPHPKARTLRTSET